MFVRCFWSLFSAFWWIGDQTHWTRYSWVGKKKILLCTTRIWTKRQAIIINLKNELKKRQAIIVFSSPPSLLFKSKRTGVGFGPLKTYLSIPHQFQNNFLKERNLLHLFLFVFFQVHCDAVCWSSWSLWGSFIHVLKHIKILLWKSEECESLLVLVINEITCFMCDHKHFMVGQTVETYTCWQGKT